MHTADPDSRQVYITGLRQLADYLAEHAGIPVPQYGTTILVALEDQEDGGRADVDYVASEYLWPVHDENGCYEAYRVFGPVGYQIYTLTKDRMARHRAESSYRGCVTPDEATSNA
jgi:hypothetical protein